MENAPMNLDELVGLTEQAAVVKIKASGYRARVKSRDGETVRGDCAAHASRVSLWIEKDLVTKASFG
jgi:hypothetical protein